MMEEIPISTFQINNQMIRYVKLKDMSLWPELKGFEDSLFVVGSDLLHLVMPLTNCSNYYRVHLKMKKQGYAVKTDIKYAKLESIPHAKGIWFYSVSGVFSLAFENCHKVLQHYLFTHFMDEWFLSYHQPPLPDHMILAYMPDKKNTEYVPHASNQIELTCSGEELMVTENSLPHSNTSNVNTEHENIVNEQLCKGKDSNDGTKSGQHNSVSQSSDVGNIFTVPETSQVIDIEASKVSKIQAVEKDDINIENFKTSGSTDICFVLENESVSLLSDVESIVKNLVLEKKLKSNIWYKDDNSSCIKKNSSNKNIIIKSDKTSKKETLLNLCTLVISFLQYDISENVYIFNLIQQWLEFTKQFNNLGTDEFNNDFNLPLNENKFLCFLCHHLGYHLRQFRSKILEKSEHFKQDHISCIDNLPPAKSIVNEIFPKCMIMLFGAWMDESLFLGNFQSNSEELNGDSPRNEASTDESYTDLTPPRKIAKLCSTEVSDTQEKNSAVTSDKLRLENIKCSEISDKLYPFIQLLLEFANGSLVSGVAHVVFPRLLYST